MQQDGGVGYLTFKRKKQEQNGVWGQGKERGRESGGGKSKKIHRDFIKQMAKQESEETSSTWKCC